MVVVLIAISPPNWAAFGSGKRWGKLAAMPAVTNAPISKMPPMMTALPARRLRVPRLMVLMASMGALVERFLSRFPKYCLNGILATHRAVNTSPASALMAVLPKLKPVRTLLSSAVSVLSE